MNTSAPSLPATHIDVFCAPDLATFNAVCEDLRQQATVLHEAATSAAGVEVPFVLTMDERLMVLFGAPLDSQLDQNSLQQLAQGVVSYHYDMINPAHGNHGAIEEA